MTATDGSYDITFDGKTYMVSVELKQQEERTVIVSVIDGVKTSASVVVMGHSVHLFTAVSLNIIVKMKRIWPLETFLLFFKNLKNVVLP